MGFMQSDWEVIVVIDLFMGGGGAGLLVLAALLWFIDRERHSRAVACGAWGCFVCIIIGLLRLLADVGQPFRAMIMPVSFSHFTSWMTFGAWFMFLTLIASFVLAVCTTKKVRAFIARGWKSFERLSRPIANVAAGLGIAAGFMVTVYTGCLICSATGVPFWSTWLLPVSFCASAFYLAAAVMCAIVCKVEGDEGTKVRRVLSAVTLACGAVFAVALAFYLANASSGALVQGALLSSEGAAETARTSAAAVVSGHLAPLFWAGLVVVGLVTPLVLAVVHLVAPLGTRRFAVAVVLAICALVGVFAWRYLVLAVGVHQLLSSVDVMQIAAGASFALR